MDLPNHFRAYITAGVKAVCLFSTLVTGACQEGAFAPSDGSLLIRIGGAPTDPTIQFTVFIEDSLPPFNRITNRIGLGESITFDDLGGGFKIRAGLRNIGVHRCRLDETRYSLGTFFSTKDSTVVIELTPAHTDSIVFTVFCRTADLALIVSGLPAERSASVHLERSIEPKGLQALYLQNGTTTLQFVPDPALSVRPFRVPSDNALLFEALDQTVNVPNRQSTTVRIEYKPVGQSPCGQGQPLGWYRMDGDALDARGNTHGTLAGPTAVADRSGNANSALAFDGTDDRIELGDVFNTLALPFSLSAWIYQPADARGSFRSILATDDQLGLYTGIWFMTSPTGMLSVSYASGGTSTTANRRTGETLNPVPTDSWVHVAAIVRGPTDMLFYVNGGYDNNSYSGTGGTLVHSPAPARIGSFRLVEANRPWLGLLDDLRIYDCALSYTDVRVLFSGG
ncbi:MAG: LamG domain-containing protein [Longimicrobiales bacterium]